jgi:hypothetical protein
MRAMQCSGYRGCVTRARHNQAAHRRLDGSGRARPAAAKFGTPGRSRPGRRVAGSKIIPAPKIVFILGRIPRAAHLAIPPPDRSLQHATVILAELSRQIGAVDGGPRFACVAQSSKDPTRQRFLPEVKLECEPILLFLPTPRRARCCVPSRALSR